MPCIQISCCKCLVWYPEQILIVDKTEVSVKVWHMFNMFQWFLVITCSSHWLSTALHQFLPSSFYKPDSSYQIIYLSFIPSSWHWPFHIRWHVVSWGYKQLSRNFIVNEPSLYIKWGCASVHLSDTLWPQNVLFLLFLFSFSVPLLSQMFLPYM